MTVLGTGSGKLLTYLLPAVLAVLSQLSNLENFKIVH